MFGRKNNNQVVDVRNFSATEKKHVALTGILMDALIPGMPAQYLCNGSLIRTSTVKEILEAAPNYVRFETRNSIYTIAYEKLPEELSAAA